jgi:hypothetical protein
MANVGDFCYRDANGTAVLSLPFRVTMPDGSTRTDPSQWWLDEEARAASGFTESTLTQEDLDLLFPPEPPPPEPTWIELGYDTGLGWRMGWQADDVALLTGMYVLGQRAAALGIDQPVVVFDMEGIPHAMTFAEFDVLILTYGAARVQAAMEAAQ